MWLGLHHRRRFHLDSFLDLFLDLGLDPIRVALLVVLTDAIFQPAPLRPTMTDVGGRRARTLESTWAWAARMAVGGLESY